MQTSKKRSVLTSLFLALLVSCLFSGCSSFDRDFAGNIGADFAPHSAPPFSGEIQVPEGYYAYVLYRPYVYTYSAYNVLLTNQDMYPVILENDSYSIILSDQPSITFTLSIIMTKHMNEVDTDFLHSIITAQEDEQTLPTLQKFNGFTISGTPSGTSYFMLDMDRLAPKCIPKGTYIPSSIEACRLSKYAVPVEDQLAALGLSAPETPAADAAPVQPQAPAAASPGSEVDRSTLPILTVFDFAVQGMSEQESMFIVDILSSALFDTRQYRILDRNQRNKILEEVEFSLSGCTDEECQLEVGQMLAADKIVTGSLGTIGNRYAINIKLIDVASGETISTAYSIYENLDALVDDCTTLAFQLAENEG